MVLQLVKRGGAVLALALLLAHPADLSSCGPFLPQAVFTGSQPDNEQAFFRGHLGILQPTYPRRYLAIAYRILSGHPLSEAQIASVSNLDRYRISTADDELKQWLAARTQVPAAAPVKIDPYRAGPNYTNYVNCNADAFRTARHTLLNLISQAGANSSDVREWLAAQDEVFVNCAEGPAIPAAPSPDASEQVRAERRYQIAAAEFYAGQFDKAQAAFRQIAADRASPWHTLAPYLIARCYLRQSDYASARRQLNAILADPAQTKIHKQTRLLLDYTLAHIDPAGQMVVLSKRMIEANASDLGRDLSDYTFLYDKLSQLPVDSLKQAAAQDDLTNWILHFQGGRNSADKANSAAWLLAALYSTGGKQPQAQSLIDAARALYPESPAYTTAQFEAARLLIEAGRKTEAVAIAENVLKQPNDISTTNAFRAARLRTAATFDDFLANAARTLDSANTFDLSDDEKRKIQPLSMFDQDAAIIFNRWLPLPLWLQSIRNKNLAGPLHAELAQSGWVRSVILGSEEREFAQELVRLKPAYAASLRSYLEAHDAPPRQFEAAFFILHHPELQPAIRAGLQRFTPDGKIDDFRDNWWIPPSTQPPSAMPWYVAAAEWSSSSMSPILMQLYPRGQIPPPDFLTPQERNESAAEQNQLNAEGAPSFLAAIVLRWATSHPSDPRNAEALALAVRTSRFSPTDPNPSNAIRDAFRLLHARYPKTTWAVQMPYWYR